MIGIGNFLLPYSAQYRVLPTGIQLHGLRPLP